MNIRMSEGVWDVDFEISKSIMDRRIKNCTRHFGWQHAVRLMLDRGKPFHNLKIAEVGCGTGTTSLTFGLLGASVTLLDFNRRVLKKAQDIHNLYNCGTELIHSDCMTTPMAKLRGKFDFVISSGLAEHFMGADREECIRYHRLLLKDGGIAYIGVPNTLSPFYQWVKTFKKLTGTWNLEVEIPFTRRELKKLAVTVGFKEAYVIGNAPLTKDLIDYSRGFGSAVKQLFPVYVQERLQAQKARKKMQSYIPGDMRRYCQDMVTAINQGYFKRPRSPLINTFSAGIILFAFN
jgi:2-polyprenyl-3-methyl-5-hydroxy-6-metoxy-1,4-benzoquinol methylase